MTIAAPANKVSIQDAATYYGVTDRTIRNWLTSGIIRGERIGTKIIRVDIDSVISQPLGGDAR